MSQLDLFSSTQRRTVNTNPPSRTKRKPTKPNGYAFHPGTGPTGETCGSCKHIVRAKRFRKCGLNRQRWTCGTDSDINGD